MSSTNNKNSSSTSSINMDIDTTENSTETSDVAGPTNKRKPIKRKIGKESAKNFALRQLKAFMNVINAPDIQNMILRKYLPECTQIWRNGNDSMNTKDFNAPVKPQTSYFQWMGENRLALNLELKALNESTDATKKLITLGVADFTKYASYKWKELPEQTRKQYNEKYKKDLDIYKINIDAYNKTKKSIQDQPSSSDIKDCKVECTNDEDDDEEEVKEPSNKKSKRANKKPAFVVALPPTPPTAALEEEKKSISKPKDKRKNKVPKILTTTSTKDTNVTVKQSFAIRPTFAGIQVPATSQNIVLLNDEDNDSDN